MSSIFPIFASLFLAMSGDTDITKPELRAIESRRAIKSGRVRISGQSSDFERREEVARQYDITFSGRRIRSLYRNSRPFAPSNAPTEWLTSNVIRSLDNTIADAAIVAASGRRSGVVIETQEQNMDTFWVDPRILGLRMFFAFGDERLDGLVARAERIETTHRTEIIGGEEMDRVTFRLKGGPVVTLWFSAAAGGSLKRATSQSENAGHTYRQEMECAFRKYSDVWFPELVTADTFRDKEHLRRDVLRVDAAEFNVPIDEKTFTIAGLELPVGTFAVQRPSNEWYTWDGAQLVPHRRAALVKGTPPPRTVSTPWVLLSIGLALVAALVLIRAWSRSRAAPKSSPP